MEKVGGENITTKPNPEFSSVSLENSDEIERVFNRFDANGDGKISPTELGDVLRALGSNTSPEELQSMVAEIDTDGNGFIDLKEFADFHGGGSKGDTSSESELKDLRDAFEMYDRDKNGLISAAELHMVLKSLGEKCSVQDCSRRISSVDADGDGCVNFEEFKKMMSNCNGNGNASSH